MLRRQQVRSTHAPATRRGLVLMSVVTVWGRHANPLMTQYAIVKTVVTCKIKHLQKCFGADNFPRLCRGRKNVVKMFYFTCNHFLSSIVFNMLKHLQKCFSVLFYM